MSRFKPSVSQLMEVQHRVDTQNPSQVALFCRVIGASMLANAAASIPSVWRAARAQLAIEAATLNVVLGIDLEVVWCD